MLAYRNDPALKEACIARIDDDFTDKTLRDHFGADDPAASIRDIAHAIQSDLGIPGRLAHLLYTLQHYLPDEAAEEWFTRFFSSITPGADLTRVADHFVLWILTNPEGPRRKASSSDTERFDFAAQLYDRRLSGDEPRREEWDQAASIEGMLARIEEFAELLSTCLHAANCAPTITSAVILANQSGTPWDRMAAKLIALIEAAPAPART
ncbi:MAG: hypothetical protein WAL34_03815 [Acidobacteriaceae bacterium]